MPRYEFMCEKCEKPFELTMTISEREKAKPKCPTCKGTKVMSQLGPAGQGRGLDVAAGGAAGVIPL